MCVCGVGGGGGGGRGGRKAKEQRYWIYKHIAGFGERRRTAGGEETTESPESTETVCLRGLVTY